MTYSVGFDKKNVGNSVKNIDIIFADFTAESDKWN